MSLDLILLSVASSYFNSHAVEANLSVPEAVKTNVQKCCLVVSYFKSSTTLIHSQIIIILTSTPEL